MSGPHTPLPPPTPGLAARILGVWQLELREDYDRDGGRRIDPMLGPNPLGILCFGPSHFAAQFTNRDRSSPVPPAVAGAQGANNSQSMGGYDAYFGTYRLDESDGRVTVHLVGALTPANIGQEFTREIRVADGRLTIQLDTNAFDGTPVTRTLIFRRVG